MGNSVLQRSSFLYVVIVGFIVIIMGTSDNCFYSDYCLLPLPLPQRPAVHKSENNMLAKHPEEGGIAHYSHV